MSVLPFAKRSNFDFMSCVNLDRTVYTKIQWLKSLAFLFILSLSAIVMKKQFYYVYIFISVGCYLLLAT